ncbi:MAG TPA: aromatic ring-opening dioxygenase subunit LigB, partial [Thermomicrobiales bacterium]|nr:aromatic ring-opening dioxygenase subunit LigB [Thermomicrobiales bacterium]
LGGVPEDDHGPQVVLITPSRAMGRQAMVDFGRVLGEAFRDDPRKIGFIASCDWGHAHTADGPYGFHPDAAKVDAKVVDAVEKNELLSLIELTDEEVQNAAIDGLWQTLILAGIQQITPLDSNLISYEHPTYFGMIVAGFSPAAQA